jgi:5-deoxy-5-amino-3-dehydroquinate synthase
VFAARLAERLGRIDHATVEEHVALVTSYDLPISPPSTTAPDVLVAIMGRDKKSAGNGLTFILDGPDGLEAVSGISADTVASLLSEMSA